MPLIQNQVEKLQSLISPRRDINRPIYNWHAFKHSYSKELVDYLISEFKLQKGSFVLDTFCGGGTTLLSCKQNNINSVGLDILPFSVFLSKVKTRNYNIDILKREYQELATTKKLNVKTSLPEIEIIHKAFPAVIQIELLKILQRIDLISNYKYRDFYKLALFSILESISCTSKAGGFLRLVEKNVNPLSIYPAFLEQAKKMITDIENAACNFKSKAIVHLGDSRNFKLNNEFDAIMTSPPYPNRHDYTRIYALELILGFVENNDDLKQLRYRTLRSHVEARKIFDSCGYEKPKRLSQNISKIKSLPLNNISVVNMLEGYFEDMYLTLKQIKDNAKPKAKVAMVVSNVRFSGENIFVDEILSEIGCGIGLKPKKILVARYRGNSSQQMKLYKRNPSRESIVIWENN